MNRTSSHAVFGFTRRRFFATTVGALVASVLPVKAATKGVLCKGQLVEHDWYTWHEKCPWGCQRKLHEWRDKGEYRSVYSGEVLSDEADNWQYVCMGCERRFHWDWVKDRGIELPHKRCTKYEKFHIENRNHWHPPGRDYHTIWLQDPRYPKKWAEA